MSRAGTLSRMHSNGQIRRGRPNSNPLRKIVGHDDMGREILECGHRKFPRKDFIGETNASSRRCPFCAKAPTGDAEGGK